MLMIFFPKENQFIVSLLQYGRQEHTLFTNLIIQDGGHLPTFNARKKETPSITFYATVEICLRIFLYARFTYVKIYASVEVHLKAASLGQTGNTISYFRP